MEGPLRERLIATRDKRHSKDHPFFELWSRGELTREQTAAYCMQHFHFVGEYLNWMAYQASQIRERDAKAYLLENLGDEENPDDRHLDMLLDYVASCGLPRESVEKAKVLPNTEALQNWGWRLVYQRPWQTALTGMFIGLESQFTDICKKIVPALHRHYGYKPGARAIRFFEQHIGADEIHAAKAMTVVERYCVSEAQQQEAIRVVEEATAKRWAYMNGIYWYALHGREDDTPPAPERR